MKRNKVNLLFVLFTAFILSTFVTFAADELSTVIFKVDTKNKEAKVKIETVVNMLKGVTEAEFDLNSKRLEVKYDPNQIDENMIQFAVESLGYPVKRDNLNSKETKENSKQDSTKK